MALKGTLHDITVIDLLQFPNAGRKTGELSVKTDSRQALVHYVEGSIVDAALGDHRGFEAIVALVDWEQGDFAFEIGAPHDERTIDEDLHRLVMKALKVRDERKLAEEAARAAAEEEKREQERSIREKGMDPAVCKRLDAWRASHGDVELVLVLDNTGAKVGESIADELTFESDRLLEAFVNLADSYPRGRPQRVFVEDERGVVAFVPNKAGSRVVLATRGQLAMGAVLMAATKLATALEEGASDV